MSRFARTFLLVVIVAQALALVSARPAAAEGTPAGAVFALVVTSNHGASANRPDLRYADDDGVKYSELFRMLGGDVVLHTELDRDSERLYPAAKTRARPPKRSDVLASARAMSERINAARSSGRTVDFYFVFAGHGDVEAGKGYLELADGRLTSDDVGDILAASAATRTHVILDSCNSFFVLAARKPGGRIVATPRELAASVGKRLPNVGVFLSTSAEAEVFEWSQVQGGIFSHSVRSGLTGAADANADGVVSYEELRAFITVATEKIKNPQLRPHVFARGPAGKNDEPMVRLASADGRRLRLGAAERIRLTVRDAEDVPVIDLHKEAGAPVEITVPERWAASATAERAGDVEGRASVTRYSLEAIDDARSNRLLALRESPPDASTAEARGAVDALRSLFASPFGPRAFAQQKAEPVDEDGSVYGVDRDHMDRLAHVMTEAAEGERDRRRRTGVLLLGSSAMLAGAGTYMLARSAGRDEGPTFLYGYAVLSGLAGIVTLAATSPAESSYADYKSRRAAASDDERAREAFAFGEERLLRVAEEERRSRIRNRWVAGVLVGVSAAVLVANELYPWKSESSRWDMRLLGGGGAIVGLGVLADSFFPAPMERLASLWANDPGHARSAPIQSFSLHVSPVAGGATAGAGFRF